MTQLHRKPIFRYLLAPLLLLTGCAFSEWQQCRRWQLTGTVISSVDSCMQCVKQFGPESPDTVRGCAVGLDAVRVIDVLDARPARR